MILCSQAREIEHQSPEPTLADTDDRPGAPKLPPVTEDNEDPSPTGVR